MSIALQKGDHLLVTEPTQAGMPEGYDWIGSTPYVVNADTNDAVVIVRQFGYPYYLAIDRAIAEQMRADLLKRIAQQFDSNRTV